jgi:type III pantothenate kinase
MNRQLLADVGNSRIKWGLSVDNAVLRHASLPHGDAEAWRRQAEAWGLAATDRCTLAGVHPEERDRLERWLKAEGHPVRVACSYRDVPVAVNVDTPDGVGIDRLLNAVAAAAKTPGEPVICVDVGSAITVDLVDAAGAFAGGAILPGLRLMAQALHQYTARLPLVDQHDAPPRLPAKSTVSAIRAGIYAAAAGGIERAARALYGSNPRVFLTGGDAPLLEPHLPASFQPWPTMTLEGLRLTAERLW